MAKAKKGLGKGLDSLIPSAKSDIKVDDKQNGAIEIKIDEIIPNELQPRKQFEKKALLELENSIAQHGLIQPIVVRKKDDEYEIIAGERRWRACKNIGLKKVPVVIKEVSDIQQAQLALVENLQREDLNPIEEAMAYDALINEYKFTQNKLSEIVAKSRSHIANTMRLLNLDDEIKKLISDKKISAGHGRALLAIDDVKKRKQIAKLICEKELSVRDVEAISQQKDTKSKKFAKTKKSKKDAHILSIQSKLQTLLGTKVEIKHGKNKGKLEIEYYGEEDLERLLEFFEI